MLLRRLLHLTRRWTSNTTSLPLPVKVTGVRFNPNTKSWEYNYISSTDRRRYRGGFSIKIWGNDEAKRMAETARLQAEDQGIAGMYLYSGDGVGGWVCV